MATTSRQIVNILPASAPRLPVATVEYSQQFMDQLNNILRLYFNGIDTTFGSLLGDVRDGTISHPGGGYLAFPHGAFSSLTTQSVSVINTPTRVAFDHTDFANDMYFVAGDGIHTKVAGIFNVQFSAQLTNADTQAHDVDIWLRQGSGSGVAADVANTASVVTVPSTHGGQPGYNVLAANFYVKLQAGDYIEFWWASNSLQVQMNYLPAITVPFASPGAPSIVATLSFVSRLPT